MAGAPKGNTNSSKENRLFTNALRRKAVQNPEVMQAVVDSIYAEAMNGNIQAAKEIFDRTDGKSIQQTEISGLDGGEIVARIERIIRDPKNDNA